MKIIATRVTGQSMSKIITLIRHTKKYGLRAGINLIKEKLHISYKKEDEYRDFLVRAKERIDYINYKNNEINVSIDIVYSSFNKNNGIGLEEQIKKQSYKNINNIFTNNSFLENKTLNVKVINNLSELIEKSNGDYIIFMEDNIDLDKDFFYAISSVLTKNKDVSLVYTDEDCIENGTNNRIRPFFKPDISPLMLKSFQYIGSIFAVRKSILKKLYEKFHIDIDNIILFNNHWYDLLLHIMELYEVDEIKNNDYDISKVNPKEVYHIPYPMFSNKVEKGFDSFYRYKKDYKSILYNHLKRIGKDVKDVTYSDGFLDIIYNDLEKEPLVSVLIPSKDHSLDLDKAMMSIATKSTYKNIEFIIIENNSEDKDTFKYYSSILGKEYNNNVEIQKGVLKTGHILKIVTWKHEFNYSKINNFGFKFSEGDIILLLNNDTEMISENAVKDMVNSITYRNIGAVGAMLYYNDNTIQHGGVVYKIGGFAANVMTDEVDKNEWYYPFKKVVHEMSACTAACLMIKRDVFLKVKGLDEKLCVALNDVDLCMKIRKEGYRILFNPKVTFYHYESKSRGLETESKEKKERFQKEIDYFKYKWKRELDAGDPYYNINLTLHKADYSVELYEDNRGRYN